MRACKHGYYYQCPCCALGVEKLQQQKAIKKALKKQRKKIARSLIDQAQDWRAVNPDDEYIHSKIITLERAAQDVLDKRF